MLTLDHVKIVQAQFTLGAHWSVAKGARVAVIGPSGAGKSTLLLAIAGFVPVADGHIFVSGQDQSTLSPGNRPLSMLFQDQNLFPHLNVMQNLGLGLDPSLRLSTDQKTQVLQVLTKVGLVGMELRKPATLSGGQQSRVALARALLRARPLLLLDEPFAALGPALKAEMLKLVAQLAGETSATVLMVTHDPQDAKQFADETILVADGLAHPPVPTEQLFANPPPALAQYLGQ